MYTTQYFIDKFTAIPEENWFVGNYVNPNNPNQCCALGHCNIRPHNDLFFLESKADLEGKYLNILFFKYLQINVTYINDDKFRVIYKQSTPKARILAALNDIKTKQQVEISDPPIYVEDMIELCEIPG